MGRHLHRRRSGYYSKSAVGAYRPALLPFVTLALDSGARYNTIRTLQWGRVDLAKGPFKIGQDKTSAGTGRTIPLNARAWQTLRHWAAQFPHRKPEHYVFPAARTACTAKRAASAAKCVAYDVDPSKPVGTIQSAWESARERTRLHCPACAAGELVERKPAKRKRGYAVEPPSAGYVCKNCGHTAERLPEGASTFRFHDLRHTFVSRLIVARVPLHIIATIVGWEPSTVIAMAKRYGHYEENTLRRAVEVISALPEAPAVPTSGSTAKGELVQ